MGEVISYEVFKEKQRIERYGDPGKRLREMNFDPEYSPFEPEYDVDAVLYGENEDEEDYWMGEKDLTHFIK